MLCAPRLVTATAVVGVAATVVGFAALGELAVLGGIHARLLVGATVLLTVWATYWQIPWLPGGIM